jgi:prepilin-type processing-associated H-X9-DG protein
MSLDKQKKFGKCNLSLISVKEAPSMDSCQITQLLFGELYVIQSVNKFWAEIIIFDKKIIGYIPKSQLFQITKKEFEQILQYKKFYTTDIISSIDINGRIIILPFGSLLYNYDGMNCTFVDSKWHFMGNALKPSPKNLDFIEILVKKMINAPYQESGNSVLGIDSIHLVSTFYKFIGINTPMNIHDLYQMGSPIDLVKDCQLGDIIFFGEKEIEHIGIVINKNNILHVDGHVKMDQYDYMGIVSKENKSHIVKKIRMIRRLIL